MSQEMYSFTVTVDTSGDWNREYLITAQTSPHAAVKALGWFQEDYPNSTDKATVIHTLNADLGHLNCKVTPTGALLPT